MEVISKQQKNLPETSQSLTTSKSTTEYSDHYNRTQLLEYKNEGIALKANKDLILTVHKLHDMLGALGSLPKHDNPKTQTAQRKEYFNDWLRYVFIEGKRVPSDIPLGFMLAEFANGLISGDYPRKGNNIAAFAEAFSGAIPDVVAKWRVRNNEEPVTPQLPASETDRICKGATVRQWPKEVVMNQCRMIDMMGGKDEFVALLGKEKREEANDYFTRLYERRDKIMRGQG